MNALDDRFPRTTLPQGPSPGIGDLQPMFDELMQADAIYRPSKFWENLVETHLAELNEDGFDQFKRTINRKYFQFQVASPFHPHAARFWKRWLKHPRIDPLRAKFTPGHALEVSETAIGRLRAASYAKYIALLADRVAEDDRLGLLTRLDEPLVGNPVSIEYRGRRISEDLCNSVAELLAVEVALPGSLLDRATVVELGSGYGRLAWAYLAAFPEIRYVLVDIPPALAVAEQYLASVFPERKIFNFRRFSDAGEIESELAESQIAFLTPNQLEALPDFRADLFINVSSLHEMTPEQIAHYFKLIDRSTEGWFYSKQWQSSKNADDELVIDRGDYPVPNDWDVVFDRTHALNPEFFEALYRVGANR
jgi:putative sugar O-methyltransferase